MPGKSDRRAAAEWARLAAWMADPAWQPSALALRRAEDALIDTVACMVAGVGLPAQAAVRAAAATWGDGAASLVGGGRSSAPVAALVNGTAAHALDFDDHDAPTLAHPSAVLVPALLAAGEVAAVDGARLLRAYIVGLEVMDRLGEIVNPGHYEIGWHSTSTLGSVAAAGAVAALRGLDSGQILAALSIGATTASGLKAQFGSGTKPFHAGWAAHNGVVAAELAAQGLTAVADALSGAWGFTGIFGADAASSGAGAPRLPPPLAIEGTDPIASGAESRASAQTGRKRCGPPPPRAIELHGLWVKAYPCCSYMGRPLDAVLQLRAAGRVTAEQVERVQVSMSQRQIDVVRYAIPASGDEARFSIPWCLAVALREGSVAPRHFEAAALADPALRALAGRITLRPFADPPPLPGVSTEDYDHIAFTLAGGERLEVLARSVRGSPDNPLTRGELFDKLAACAEGRIDASRRAALVALLEDFERATTLRPLMALLRAPEQRVPADRGARPATPRAACAPRPRRR